MTEYYVQVENALADRFWVHHGVPETHRSTSHFGVRYP